MTSRSSMFAAGIVILVLCAGALYWWSAQQSATSPVNSAANESPATSTAQSSTILPGVPDKTYTDSKLSFSLGYPATATASAVDYSGYLTLTQTPLISFTLPRAMFQGTNLAEAGVYVGASSSPAAITSCASPVSAAGETPQGTATINGADFSVFQSSGAGAGNFYQSKTYRRIENGWCVELVELLHSTNIGNYTPGTVVAFDQAQYQNILERIVHTYRSIPTGQ